MEKEITTTNQTTALADRAFPVDRPWYACQIAYPDEIVGNIYDDPDLLKQGEDTQK